VRLARTRATLGIKGRIARHEPSKFFVDRTFDERMERELTSPAVVLNAGQWRPALAMGLAVLPLCTDGIGHVPSDLYYAAVIGGFVTRQVRHVGNSKVDSPRSKES
jgi:hypothetical protein